MSSSALDTLFSDFWEWRLQEFPEFGTFCGLHQHDDRLDDISLEAYKRKEEAALGFLERCRKLAIDQSLSEDNRFNLTLLTEDLTIYTTGMKYKGYLLPVNYMEGLQSDFEQLVSWMKFDTVNDYEKYLSRLQGLPKRVDQTIELLQEGIRAGMTNHEHTMRAVFDSFEAHAKPVKETVFYEPFTRLPTSLDKQSMESLEKKVVCVIEQEVQPAYKKLQNFVEKEYMQQLRKGEGVCNLPGGGEFYKECLKHHISLDLTPQQVHDIGLEEVARLRALMEEATKKTGFEGTFKEFLHYLRTDEKFYFKTKESVIEAFRDVCYKKIRPVLPTLFKKIPESQLIIEAVPESRINAPAGYYLAGTLDGSRPGKFYANLNNLSMCPSYEMMTLSLHEGEPGHHFQGMYAIEQKDVPPFRQYLEDFNYFSVPSRFPMHTAYVEGWGLYCEHLGKEMGLYEDLYSWFGHLSFNMHRACRLVIDTGIHAMGWTHDQALNLLQENTALAESFIKSEVRRYITWPGQACAYKIGEMKLKELRQKAADELGTKFSVHDFHEEVLRCGPVPLYILEKVVQQYIDQTKSAH